MKASILAIAAAGAGSCLATRARCLFDDDVAQGTVSTFSHIVSRRQNATGLPASINVDVHFHITSTTENADMVTDDIIAAQWSILSETFSKYNINMNLKSIEKVVDDLAGAGWLVYNGSSWNNYPEEKNAFFQNTRKGGYDELNLYFFAPWTPGASGYCTFPTVAGNGRPQPGDDVFDVDACQISALTMPGIPAEKATSLEGYTLGHVAIHETGHWFGLNHTFAGGCNEPGDFVEDTPATGLVYDCPAGSDTCPGVPGLDPIHNFMSYTNDTCTNEFTPGQKERMFEIFYSYRRDPE